MRAMYGDTPQGRQLLIARRLIERGVRFVQAWHSGWDHHSQIETALRTMATASDQATAALLADLKQRGLLDETLILWGGEFGRTPMSDGNLNVDNTKGKAAMILQGSKVDTSVGTLKGGSNAISITSTDTKDTGITTGTISTTSDVAMTTTNGGNIVSNGGDRRFDLRRRKAA